MLISLRQIGHLALVLFLRVDRPDVCMSLLTHPHQNHKWLHGSNIVSRLAIKHIALIKSNKSARQLYPIRFVGIVLRKHLCICVAKPSFLATHSIFFLNWNRNQWIESEEIEFLSVFLELHRTNNLSESYNSDLNGKLDFHGCMYKFLEVIKMEEFHKCRNANVFRKEE